MKPIKFPGYNVVFAKDQPEYLPLPVHKTEDGVVMSCWALSWKDRFRLLFTGSIWSTVYTLNHPLQPQRLSVTNPVLDDKAN